MITFEYEIMSIVNVYIHSTYIYKHYTLIISIHSILNIVI